MSEELLRANIEAFTGRYGVGAWKRIVGFQSAEHGPSRSVPEFKISWANSRASNEPYPILHVDGRELALHSSYNPSLEALRVAPSLDTADLVVLVGVGGGYLARSLLSRSAPGAHRILIEPVAEMFAEAMARFDFRSLIDDARTLLLIGLDELVMREVFQTHYFPQVFGRIELVEDVSWRGLKKLFPGDLQAFLGTVLREIQGDFITQSKLGKRWAYNIFQNLRVFEKRKSVLPSSEPELIVLGAGPGLEYHSKTILALRERGSRVWCTDASIGWCAANGIRPELLMSIDGQTVSYAHAMDRTFGGEETWVLDLCSHPFFARNAERIVWALSAHPLLAALNIAPDGLRLDTRGGNVGHSLVGLALSGRARRVHVFGLDFAYSVLRPYARPSLVYSTAMSTSRTLRPAETQLAELHLAPGAAGRNSGDALLYETGRMTWYKNQFHEAFGRGSEDRLRVYEMGIAADIDAGQSEVASASESYIGSGVYPSPGDLMDGVSRYLAALETMADADPKDLCWGAEGFSRTVFLSLLPLSAWFLSSMMNTPREQTDISKKAFAAAIAHTRELAWQFLNRGSGT